ncbi:hypothetical protein D3C76_902090 [compost metagenome]
MSSAGWRKAPSPKPSTGNSACRPPRHQRNCSPNSTPGARRTRNMPKPGGACAKSMHPLPASIGPAARSCCTATGHARRAPAWLWRCCWPSAAACSPSTGKYRWMRWAPTTPPPPASCARCAWRTARSWYWARVPCSMSTSTASNAPSPCVTAALPYAPPMATRGASWCAARTARCGPSAPTSACCAMTAAPRWTCCARPSPHAERRPPRLQSRKASACNCTTASCCRSAPRQVRRMPGPAACCWCANGRWAK